MAGQFGGFGSMTPSQPQNNFKPFGTSPSSGFGSTGAFGTPSATGTSFGTGGGFGGTNTFGTGTTTTPSSGFGGTSGGFGTSGGLGTNTTGAFGTGTTSGGFGATGFGQTPSSGFGATGTTGTNAFGTPTSTGFGATGTNAFGSSGGASAFGSTPTTMGFGTTPTTTGFGTSFGQSTGSAFGANNQPKTGFGTGFNSGATFGSGQPASGFSFNQGTTGFGSTLNTQQPTSSFNTGFSSGGGFGTGMFNTPQPTTLTAQQVQPEQTLQLALQRIELAYGPNSPYFRHAFYNIVHPSEVSRYARPPNFDPTLWNQAMQNMTDEERQCMVPVQAVGFADLNKRMKVQDAQIAAHSAKLKDIENMLSQIQQQHELQTAAKIQQFRRKQSELTQRILKLLKQIEVLRSKGYSILPEEEALRAKLEGLQKELDRPTQFKGRLKEMEAIVQMKELERLRSREGYQVVDEASLQQVLKVLTEQQQELRQLTDIVLSDSDDLQVISRGLSERRVIA